MNSAVHLFGELAKGYTQYPNDHTAELFQAVAAHATAPSQLVIHRDGELMYYIYVRRLHEDKYIGLCVELNGVMLTEFHMLFDIFQKTIEMLASNGAFISYSDEGNLIASAEQIHQHPTQIEYTTKRLQEAVDQQLAEHRQKLPPVNCAVARDRALQFLFTQSYESILRSSYTNGFTFIYKNKDYDTVLVNSYRGVLQRIKTENEQLSAENQRLLKKKKQFKLVCFLLILLAATGTFLIFSISKLNNTEEERYKTMEELAGLFCQVIAARDSISDLLSQVTEAEKKIDEIAETYPLVITDLEVGNMDGDWNMETDYGSTIYSSKSMFLRPRITYMGLKDIDITLYIKLYDKDDKLRRNESSPDGYTYTSSLSCTTGGEVRSQALIGYGNKNSGFWPKGNYRFEIWYNNRCLFAKRFTIH